MRLTRADIAGAVLGRLSGSDGVVNTVSIDSRQCSPQSLFVPILGARDGHDYIDAARMAGATTWFTSRPDERDGAIAVDHTQRALTMLAIHVRGKSTDRVVGVTGSTGKTSTKDLLRSVLAQRGPTTASDRSFNNELGVPLTILNSPNDAWAAVVEMGARGPGHISYLCEIARPMVGVITNIGTAHVGEFGSVAAIAAAKGELVEALPSTGFAVLNRDDAQFDVLAGRTRASVLAFGEHLGADVRAEAIRVDDLLHPAFRLRTPWGDTEVTVAASGRHQVSNAVAAAGAALALGCDLDNVAAGLAAPVLSPWRMELHRLANGATVLNDAYNANPVSMLAALRSLGELPARRRVAVLATMAELGESGPEEHRRIAAHAELLGIEVISVAEPAYGVDTAVADIDAAIRVLGELSADDAVLVKGSRVAGLERLARALVTGADGTA